MIIKKVLSNETLEYFQDLSFGKVTVMYRLTNHVIVEINVNKENLNLLIGEIFHAGCRAGIKSLRTEIDKKPTACTENS